MTKKNPGRIAALVTASCIFSLAGCSREEAVEVTAGEPVVSATTAAGGLKDTVIVPTLDTPVPEGKSAIWCSTLVLAWKEFRKLEPGAIEVLDPKAAERLDAARESTSDLPAGSFYVMAGRIEQGVVDAVRREVAERFPDKTFPDLVAPGPTGLLAYAYLQAGGKFPLSFYPARPISFRDTMGKTTEVLSFGILTTEGGKHADKPRRQVAVLHHDDDGDQVSRMRGGGRFIVDLARDSTPNQIILARIPWKGTLARTMEKVVEVAGSKGETIEDSDLQVPVLSFLVDHRFPEIEGRGLLLALQRIRFELNRFGAVVEPEAMLYKSKGDNLSFDGPFLIYLQKRGASRPFFVMWVDNAELLSKR